MVRWWEQAGAVPFRRGADGVEIGLSSNRFGSWILPKGTVDPGATPVETAEQETWEEAGWEGRLDPFPLVDVHRPKYDLDCRIRFFGLEVTREHDEFPEAWRERRWVPLGEVETHLADVPMRTAVAAWRTRDAALPRPVLIVGERNVGVSMLAECLWRAALETGELATLPVASAGLAARSGAGPSESLRRRLADHDLDVGAHRARPLGADLLAVAETVLATDAGVAARVAAAYPQTAGRVAVLLDALPPLGDSAGVAACLERLRPVIDERVARLRALPG